MDYEKGIVAVLLIFVGSMVFCLAVTKSFIGLLAGLGLWVALVGTALATHEKIVLEILKNKKMTKNNITVG